MTKEASPKTSSATARSRWKLLSSAIVRARAQPKHTNNDRVRAGREGAIRFPSYGLVEITEEDGEEEDLSWYLVQSRDKRFKFHFKVCSLPVQCSPHN